MSFDRWTIENWLDLALLFASIATPLAVAFFTPHSINSSAYTSGHTQAGSISEESHRKKYTSFVTVPLTIALFMIGMLMIGSGVSDSGIFVSDQTDPSTPTYLALFAMLTGALCLAPFLDLTLGRAFTPQKQEVWRRATKHFDILVCISFVVIGLWIFLLSIGIIKFGQIVKLPNELRWFLMCSASAVALLTLFNVKRILTNSSKGHVALSVDLMLCLSLMIYPLVYSSAQIMNISDLATNRDSNYDLALGPGVHALLNTPIDLKYGASERSSASARIEEPQVVKIIEIRANGYVLIDWDGLTGFVPIGTLHPVEFETSIRGYAQGPKRGQEIANRAVVYIGYPYVWGTHGPASFDAPGFTYWIFADVREIDIGWNLNSQVSSGMPVNKDDLQIGDLVFFQNTYTSGLSHVGIYIGNGLFVHAPNEEQGVTVSDLNSPYWKPRWYGATRVF